ncbi:MAG TPA: glutathione peroxidase [Kofleriaceae bacterium]|nr:glutathione peroxidase [Kofleriaceae bacterium]
MKKLALLLVLAAACSKKEPAPAVPEAKVTTPPAPASQPAAAPTATTPELATMWNTPLKTLQGKDTKLADYKGKALLLVNVASKCGLTPQYTQLEELQKKYEAKGFTVIGFPCNQFGGQEPGTAEEIATFCATKYGITFPIMEKIEVNGEHRHPVYQALTPIKGTDGHDGDIRWNFEKFVVSADGKQITRFDPKTKPDDPKVIAAVEAALPKH